MPDMNLQRRGDVTALPGHAARRLGGHERAGEERGTGTNVFTLRGDGKIESVTGFWDAPRDEPALRFSAEPQIS